MSHQYNQTGDFGQAVYGPASGPQHIASAPAVMAGGKRRRRTDKKRSEKKRSEKKQRGGKKQRKSQRQSRKERQSRRQRGGK